MFNVNSCPLQVSHGYLTYVPVVAIYLAKETDGDQCIRAGIASYISCCFPRNLFTLRYEIFSNMPDNSHFADCKQRVTQYVVPFMTHIRTKETKPAVVGQVQGYLISSFVICDTEVTLPYWFLRYHGLVPINKQDLGEQLL